MQGFPPPPDRIIRFDLAGNMFPRTRYGYSHMREFVPTRVVWRGDGPVSKLPRAERDISGVLFTDPNGTRRTFAEALKLTAPDLLSLGLIDGVIPEPVGGAHRAPMVAMEAVKRQILAALDELSAQPVEALVRARREKYRRAGALPGRFPVLA